MKKIISVAVLGVMCAMSGANAANIIRMSAPITIGVHEDPKTPSFSLIKASSLVAKIGRSFTYNFFITGELEQPQ